MPTMDYFVYSQIVLTIHLWYTVLFKIHRILQFGDSTDCVIKLMELGSIHKSKEGIFEMTSNNGGRLETLHWSNPPSRTFVPGLSDSVLIDGTHKTNIYCNHCS